MKYLCLVYLDEPNWSAAPDNECRNCGQVAAPAGTIAAEAVSRAQGHDRAGAQRQGRRDRRAVRRDQEQFAGFYLIDAADLNEAIQRREDSASARVKRRGPPRQGPMP
jgi:hypothetical protein